MKRLVLITAAVLSLAVAVGCTHVTGASGGNTGMVNDAWFTDVTTIPLPMAPLIISARVYYCPAASGGAATCMEAEMIENANPGSGGGGEAAPAAAAPAEEAAEDAGEAAEEAAE